MKNIILFVLIYICILSRVVAQQPQWLNPLPYGSATNDIEFFDSQRGLMVGDNGAVAISSDGGQTWQNAANYTTLSLKEVEILQPDHALIMADTCLFETVDGGVTLSVRCQLSGYTFLMLDMITEDQGWALVQVNQSTSTRLAKTTDGGSTWSISSFQGIPSSLIITCIAFKSMDSGLVMGHDFDYESVYRTYDGGLTFSVTKPLFDEYSLVIKYGGNNTYYVGGGVNDKKEKSLNGGLISKTTDDGETWTSILYPGLGSGGLLFSRIKILDDSLIVVSGKCANDCDKWPIMTSKDGGVTWTENQIHPNYYGYSPEVMALAVVSNSRIVGYERAMNLPINTNDFENWYYNQGSFGGFLASMVFIGDLGFMTTSRSVLKSVDGGVKWDTCYGVEYLSSQTISSLAFANSDLGMLATRKYLHKINLLRTTDAGATWSDISSIAIDECINLWYPTWDKAWMFGRERDYANNPTKKRLLYSIDAGVSWEDKLLPVDTINQCLFTDASRGYLFGGAGSTATGGYYLTTDGAGTWDFHPLALPELTMGNVVSNDLLYVVASTSPKTVWRVDAANSDQITQVFTAEDGKKIVTIRFIDKDRGVIIVSKGESEYNSYIYQTTNGGQTWQVFGPYLSLYGVTLFYDLNGFAWGSYGRLLQLANGYPVNTPSVEKGVQSRVLTARSISTSDWIEATINTTEVGQATLSLTDLTGRMLGRWPVTLTGSPQTLRLPLHGMSSGLLILNLQMRDSRSACKVIVN